MSVSFPGHYFIENPNASQNLKIASGLITDEKWSCDKDILRTVTA